MAQSLRNLQIFRNGELLTGSVADVKALINGAFADGIIVLKDGEPISIRYKETNESTEIKSLFGVAYVNGENKSILWNESGITIETDPKENAYVTLNYDVDDSGNYTLTVGTHTVAIEDAKSAEGETPAVNGLATALDVKTYVDNQLSAFSPDAITAVNGEDENDSDYVKINAETTKGVVNLSTTVTIAESIENADTDNNGLVTAVQVKDAIDTAVNAIVIPELPEYTITPLKNAEEGYLKTYQLFKGTEAVEGSIINIPKDYLVKSASIKTVETENVPEEGYKVGDKYFDFVINIKDATTEDQHLYINAKDLVDTYVAGDDISITDNNTINVSLSNAITPNTTVGFVSPSNPIPAGASLEDVLRKILVKEVLATKVSPTNSLTVSGAAEREVGTALGTITLTPNYTDGYYISSDTTVYTNAQFNTNNNTTNGKLNAGCESGAVTYYKGTATITDQVDKTEGFQYVDNETTTKNTTYSFQITTAYEASTVNECKTSSGAVQEISIDGGTTSKSDAKTVKFYHKTYVNSIQGLVWDAAKGYLVKDGVQYVPETTLKDTMSTDGELLTSTTQNKTENPQIPAASSLCVIVPKDVTFTVYSTSDSSQSNLFNQFKKYSTTNQLNIEYDIYIYCNNGDAAFTVTGLTYSNIE